MSSQSIKYHKLPSLKDLKAFREGKLTEEKVSYVRKIAALNPMVSAVIEEGDLTDLKRVERISGAINQGIYSAYLKNRGFWSNYAGWIGLSSLAIILGMMYLFVAENDSPRYIMAENGLVIDFPDKSSPVHLMSDGSTVEETIDVTEPLNPGQTSTLDMVRELSNTELQDKNSAQTEKVGNLRSPLEEKESGISSSKKGGKEAVPSSDANSKNLITEKEQSGQKSGKVLLALSEVHILAKLNPDDFKTTSKNSYNGKNPLGRSDTKRAGNANYSLSDLPSFPGGDEALVNYFKGKMRPIQVPAAEDKFDRSVMIELEINSRGKLKESKIFGNLHPTHQTQLQKAIDELPQFEKGKGESVKYSLSVSF
ncbi:MAG: hypothetical protein R3277_12710 [Brumimicrobium sp.]|nr:hypothetical protein [Brumimicrobium sp.]